MLSAIGTLPQTPPVPGSELVPFVKYAISVPAEGASGVDWRSGAVLSAVVRYERDQLLLKVGDKFFTSRPIPGVAEFSRLALQVARDMSGKLILVPLLPLAGEGLARIGGTPAASGENIQPLTSAEALAIHQAAVTRIAMGVAPTSSRPQIQTLADALRLPQALMQFLTLRTSLPLSAIGDLRHETVVENPVEMSALPSILRALETGLEQSGLFLETKLKDRRSVPVNDVKRRILQLIDKNRLAAATLPAWDALDELLGLQTAATLADELGGSCLSFGMPSLDGIGGWWITFQQDKLERPLEDEAGRNRNTQDRFLPWRIRLVGVSLPFGELDIQVHQADIRNIGVSLICQSASGEVNWDSMRSELARRLDHEGLNLSNWSVTNMAPTPDSEAEKSGLFRSLIV